jgi:tetratricopeptide (TPR) repeat protein
MKRKQKKTTAVLSTAAAPAAPVAAGSGSRDVTIVWGALIASVVALVVYLPSLRNGFLSNWDDNRYILDNVHIQSMGGRFFRWAFLDYKTNLWHPLSWISHAVDYAVWGLNPLGHHLTNILLHAVNSGIVVLFTAYLLTLHGSTKRVPGAEASPFGRSGVMIASVVTGVLFAVHPMHVESVAWVTERKDLLYALFYLLSMACYCRYVTSLPDGEAGRRFLLNGTYLGALLLFFLALASKPMAVTLPVVLLVFDWYPLRRMAKRRALAGVIAEKLPFFLLSALISLVTVIAQKDIGGLKSMSDATPAFRLLLAAKALALYLLRLIFPIGLSPLYPYPRDHSLVRMEYLAALLFMAALTAVCIRYRKERPVFLAVLLVFVISLLPVLGLLQAGVQAMADRFMYLACLGPLLLIGLGTASLWQRCAGTAGPNRQKPLAVVVVVLVAGCSLSYLTIRQIAVWKDAVTLWSYVIAKTPERFSDLYLYRGEAFEHAGQPDRALQDYATAISLDAGDYNAYVHHGTMLLNKGELDPAIADFDRAISVSPDAVDAYNNRGNAYRKKGNLERALQEYDTAVAKKPEFYLTYVNRASAYVEKGDVHKAIADLTKVLSLEPELAKIYSARGGLNMVTGNVDQALADYNRACSLGFEEACRKAMFPF